MKLAIRKFALAAISVFGLAIGALTAGTATASAAIVCDNDGDDCWRTGPRGYYEPRRDWDDRYERRWWNGYRDWDAYPRWYRNRGWESDRWRDYRHDPYYGRGNVWFSF